jgi:hypothetical protein
LNGELHLADGGDHRQVSGSHKDFLQGRSRGHRREHRVPEEFGLVSSKELAWTSRVWWVFRVVWISRGEVMTVGEVLLLQLDVLGFGGGLSEAGASRSESGGRYARPES